ncbi:MAG: hypothetical protein Q8R92_02390, partial [Deltaproteobacteria bacterium]|nr:hypothetical protein [Deltaproteobacteria bacterium]
MRPFPHALVLILLLLGLVGPVFVASPLRAAGPARAVDIATLTTDEAGLHRVHGSAGRGSNGVPVAGGFDCDGDGHRDMAFSAMTARPLGRNLAGEAYLVFGDGTVQGTLDSAGFHPDILKIYGDGLNETAGSELWMDDVTGDGLGDLLVARQNFSPVGRIGAGALTILVGGPALRAQAATLAPLDLCAPPPGIVMTTLVGDAAFHRLGIWMRIGDVTGDGIADIVVGADQSNAPLEAHRGAAWVVRGGPHLALNQTIDLAVFGAPAFDATPLAGHVARITPPLGSFHHHFGATCQIADLDGNGRGEVLVALTLNRAGAGIPAFGAPFGQAHATGGSLDGTLYIAWDDNFEGDPWPAGFTFDISASPGSRSIIDGGFRNRNFGEEILGGLDYDADGAPDLFVGDIVGDGTVAQNRGSSGTGHVLYDAAMLKGLVFDLDAPPPGLALTTILGGRSGDIAADTATQGDFDGDGIGDLAFSSPHASPLGRANAGTIHVFHGQPGQWPALIDLAPGALPPASEVRIAEFYGAHGNMPGDTGDVLCYSAAAGDIDGDGRTDIITNEMLGNGIAPGTTDTGNLIVLGGSLLTHNDVAIDIRPPDPRNRFTLTGSRPITVAVLGSETVDVDDIDRATVVFGPARAPASDQIAQGQARSPHSYDVNRDGIPDLR